VELTANFGTKSLTWLTE